MKVGDLVNMNVEDCPFDDPALWGTGVVIRIDFPDCLVWWATVGYSWEAPEALEFLSESRNVG